jgi:hypothetical protein
MLETHGYQKLNFSQSWFSTDFSTVMVEVLGERFLTLVAREMVREGR